MTLGLRLLLDLMPAQRPGPLARALTCWGLLGPAPRWFWLVLSIGALIRVYLAVATDGTADAIFWERHAIGVSEKGLVAYYHENPMANHPPFISYAAALAWRFAKATGTPFKIWLRLPFAIVDFGSMLLLLAIFQEKTWRFVTASCYWLHPLAIIFSAYHGNTDSAVAFFLLLCVQVFSGGNIIGAGVALGVGLWIKLPIELAIPALLVMAPGMRNKIVFLGTALITATIPCLPALFQDPVVLITNLFGYRGSLLGSPGGDPLWGFRVIANTIRPQGWPSNQAAPILYLVANGWKLGILGFWLLVWLRRSKRSALEVAGTIGAGYTIFYGFTDSVTFQYFAWALPFWFFLDEWFLVSASFLVGGYVYSLYWLLCGNPWLLGEWDF